MQDWPKNSICCLLLAKTLIPVHTYIHTYIHTGLAEEFYLLSLACEDPDPFTAHTYIYTCIKHTYMHTYIQDWPKNSICCLLLAKTLISSLRIHTCIRTYIHAGLAEEFYLLSLACEDPDPFTAHTYHWYNCSAKKDYRYRPDVCV